MAAWICFYDRKDTFKAFLERVLRLKEVFFHSEILILTILSLFFYSVMPMDNLTLGLMSTRVCSRYISCNILFLAPYRNVSTIKKML